MILGRRGVPALGLLALAACGVGLVAAPLTAAAKTKAVLTGVSTPLVRSGVPVTLVVDGRGLAQAGAADRIVVDGATITSRTVLGDTAVSLTLDALAPGVHAVSLPNEAGTKASIALVGAADGSEAKYKFVPKSGGKRTSLFDPVRQAVFTAGYEHDYLTRYMRVDGAWKTKAVPVAAIDNVAMSFDHRTLYVTSGPNGVLEIDPDTLKVRRRLTTPFGVQVSISRTTSLGATSDGRVWLNQGGGYYDTLSGQFGDFAIWGQQQSIAAPLDGSRLFLGQLNGADVYTTATQTVAPDPLMPQVYAALTLSSDARKRVVDWSSVYDRNWAFLGYANEQGASGDIPGYAGVPSADGSRVYALVSDNSNNLPTYHIGVFDPSHLAKGTNDLFEVGQIAVPDQARCDDAFWNTGGSWCDIVGTLMIDPLGDALYWSGDRGLVVIPIPATLRPTGEQTSPQD